MKEIDTRGRPCPQPVLMVLEAIKRGEKEFLVLLDSAEAVQNVQRALQSQGYGTETSRQDNAWRIRAASRAPSAAQPTAAPAETANTPGCQPVPGTDIRTLIIQSESLGRGSDELGRRILSQLLNTLAVSERPPQHIVLINGGARLAAAGYESVEPLRELEQKGVPILVCGTCINHFGLEGKLAVGRATNAYEVLNLMLDGGVMIWG